MTGERSPEADAAELTWPGIDSDLPRARRAAARCARDLQAVCDGLGLGVVGVPVRPCRLDDLWPGHPVSRTGRDPTEATQLGFVASLVVSGVCHCSAFVGAGLDDEQMAYMLVDQLSQDFTELLAAYSIPRARHWPLCRFHDHSLGLVLDDAGATWECPTDPSWRAKVGEVASLVGQ